MPNIMNMADIRNNVSRNGFDLSSKRNFTAKAGELLPAGAWEIIPGDVANISVRSITRTKPANTPAFARIREYYDFYFVPYELLWNRAYTVLTQMNYNTNHSDSIQPDQGPLLDELPYMTVQQIATYINEMATAEANPVGLNNYVNYFGYSRAKQTVKLLEYLGYGNYEPFLTKSWGDPSGDNTTMLRINADVNMMALLAYQKIYADYFRNQQWEKIQPSTFNVDYMTGKQSMQVQLPSSITDPFYTNYNMFDLRYCDWQKDLFHGVLPRAQYGDEAVVPMSVENVTYGEDGFTPLAVSDATGFGNGAINSTNGNELRVPAFNLTGGSEGQFGRYNGKPLLAKSISDPQSPVVNLSILALRQAEFLQKWKEIAQAGNQDYKDFISRVWNTSVGDGYSERCEYLGGIDGNLDFNEVTNQNLADGNAAELAGKGFGISNGNIRFDSRGRYGVLMCIYHVLPIVDYTTDYLAPMHTRVNAADFANPVFDKVGMQPVHFLNFDNGVAGGDTSFNTTTPMGYAPRYIDYKTAIDLSVGDFKRTLKAWVLSYGSNDIVGWQTGSARPEGPSTTDDIPQPEQPDNPINMVAINYVFFKMSPKVLDPIFADNATEDMSTDQFLCSSFFDVKMVRNLDTNGLPY